MNRLITIIIPVFNVEAYLPLCIESVLNQSFSYFECLLINDGSNDNSAKICDNYAEMDGRVRVIHKHNEGVSAARNMGLENAKGEYIVFVDSDDLVEEDFLSTLMAEKEIADITFYGSVDIYLSGRKKIHSPQSGYYIDRGNIWAAMAYLKYNDDRFEYFGYTWNKMFKREIIEKYAVRFEPNLRVREDELFTMQYCRYIHSLRIMSFSPYNYRVLNTGLTSGKKNAEQFLLLANKIFAVLPEFRHSDFYDIQFSSVLSCFYGAASYQVTIKQRIYFLRKMVHLFYASFSQERKLYGKKIKLIFKYRIKLYNYLAALSLLYFFKNN